MPIWLSLLIAIIAVICFRRYAFRGTNGVAFALDIIIVIVVTILLSDC